MSKLKHLPDRLRSYTSRSEFVKEAIRWYLREVTNKPLDR